VLIGRFGTLGSGSPAKFLDRTESDAIGLAEGAVYCAGFGDTHLGAVDHGGNVGRVGVSVTDEAARTRGFVDDRLEDPATGVRVADFLLKSSANSIAPPTQGDLKETSVCHVPLAFDVENLSFQNGKV